VTVRRFSSEADWIAAALGEFRAAAAAALSEGKDSLSLCLAGGRSPEVVYRAMASESLSGLRVDLWLGDERAVPLGGEASNFGMIERSFSACAWEKPPRLHPWLLPPESGLSDPVLLDRAAREYAAALESALGPRPSFDLALLGLGADGHTMSLFPGSPALEAGEALAVAARAPVAPFDRLTLTLAALVGARRIAFLARGNDKAEAVALLESEDTSIPASRLAAERTVALYLA
jgi:6-phosphogluconolactonase